MFAHLAVESISFFCFFFFSSRRRHTRSKRDWSSDVCSSDLLGYVDSGMMGTPENDVPGSFWQADVDEAAERLAAILREERADVLLTYDDHGNYGHPDHIKVHTVGVRAAELAGTADVYEATMNRDETRRM